MWTAELVWAEWVSWLASSTLTDPENLSHREHPFPGTQVYGSLPRPGTGHPTRHDARATSAKKHGVNLAAAEEAKAKFDKFCLDDGSGRRGRTKPKSRRGQNE